MELDPLTLTIRDLCKEALEHSGMLAEGQTPSATAMRSAQVAIQSLLHQWERKRWLVFRNRDIACLSKGNPTYTVGDGQEFDTGAGSFRPQKLEAAYFRQLVQSPGQAVDYPLTILASYEDFSRLSLKTLQSWPLNVFYDPAWPTGTLHVWPVPLASIYELHIIVRHQLPTSVKDANGELGLPPEYWPAIVYNAALYLRARYQVGTYNGDQLPRMAADALKTLSRSNAAIPTLELPKIVGRRGKYNIFSDQN
jgi:hypothetical protein